MTDLASKTNCALLPGQTGAEGSEVPTAGADATLSATALDAADLTLDRTGNEPSLRLAVDVLVKYDFKILTDGTVKFTLPAGATYLDLFRDANQFCADQKNTGIDTNIANNVDPGTLSWFAARATASQPEQYERSHEILSVPEARNETLAAQTQLLDAQGLSLPSPEAAVAASALYYCATGRDLFEAFTCVRTNEPGIMLRRLPCGVCAFEETNFATRREFVSCVGERKR